MPGPLPKPPHERQRRNRLKVIHEICSECWRPAVYRAGVHDGEKVGPFCERCAREWADEVNQQRNEKTP